MAMDFKGFKKVHEDEDKAVMRHPKGHEITIAKKGLSFKLRRHLKELPLHQDEGGAINKADSNPISQGFSGATGLQSLGIKSSKYMADGGEVDQSQPEGTEVVPQDPQQMQQAQQVNPIGADNGMPEAPAPQQPQDPMQSIPGYSQAQNALNLQASGQKQVAQAQASALQQHLAAQQQMADTHQQYQREMLQNIQNTTNDINAGHINPNHLMQNTSTLGKVGMAIGMILAGYGTKGQGPNPALTFLNQQIDRDVDAQKAELGKSHTLLSAYQKQYGDDVIAENMTRATLANQLSDKIALSAAQNGSQQADAAKLMAQSELMRNNLPLVNAAASRKMIMDAQGGQGQGQTDPASLINHLTDPQTGKPPSDSIKQKIADEVGKSTSASKNEKAMLDSFDKASKENTVLRTGAGLLRTPESMQALHSFILPLIKDQEGRVTPAEMDAVSGLLPKPGDTDEKVAAKRVDFQKLIEAKKEAPLAKAYGLDLEKFNRTKSAEAPQEATKTVNGVTYRRGPNGEAIPVK